MEVVDAELFEAAKALLGAYWPHALIVLAPFIWMVRRYPKKWNIFLTLLRAKPGGETKEKKKHEPIIITNGRGVALLKTLEGYEKRMEGYEKRMQGYEKLNTKLVSDVGYIKGLIEGVDARFTDMFNILAPRTKSSAKANSPAKAKSPARAKSPSRKKPKKKN